MNYLIILQLVIYLLFALFGRYEQISDGETYRVILNELFNYGGLYPNNNHIFDNYINNPGAVNVYLFVLKLFNSNNIRILFVFNALLIWSGNYLVLKTIRNNKLFFIVLSTLYLANIALVNTLSSDVLSYFLICYFIYILSEKNKTILKKYYLLAFLGIIIAFFDYVRPVGGLFLYSIILSITLLYKASEMSIKMKGVRILVLVLSFFCFKLIITQVHYFATGIKINGSISTGYNLLMGTGVKSDGSWTSGVFNPGGKGYFKEIKNTNVKVKNERWIKQSLDTIILNPTNFFVKGFRKLSLTFGYDLLAIQNITNPHIKTLSLGEILINPNLGFFNWSIVLINNFAYYFILFWFITNLCTMFFQNQINMINFVNVTLIFFLVMYLMVIFFIIGGARYHHILMPVMLYFNFYNFQFKNES